MTARTVERIRHELKFRIAEVVSAERLTPLMVRVTLTHPDFENFASDAHDDHVKLFIAEPGTQLALPERGPNGLIFPEGSPRPEGRDYTPRSFDRAARQVVIDFVLHGEGPATRWAEAAKPGDTIGIGGPRGSFVVRGDFDWYFLAGDETALPAMARRIEELPQDAHIVAFIEVPSKSERQDLGTRPGLEIHWLHRDETGTGGLLAAVTDATLPSGDAYAFIAGEASTSTALRDHLVETRRFDPEFVKAAGYWRRGEADFYDGHGH